MGNQNSILGQHIKAARQRLGLKQKELAEKAGFSHHQIVSQIEQGQRDVKAWELARLADVLKVELSEFFGKPEPQPEAFVLWRRYPSENRAQKEATFLQRCRQYASLEAMAGEPVERALPGLEADSGQPSRRMVRQLAEDVRKQLDLGARPAASLMGTLEDSYGVKLWYEDLGQDGSGACTRGSFGKAILLNSVEAPWRRNYSCAHELFHLLTWQSIPPQLVAEDEGVRDRAERFAELFASALLLPAEPVRNAAEARTREGHLHHSDIIDIARSFDVSTDALLFRLKDLRCVNADDVEKLRQDRDFRVSDRRTMGARWWTPPALPPRFVRLAFAAYQKGRISRARLAQYLETSLIDLTDALLEYGLDDREDYETDVRAVGC